MCMDGCKCKCATPEKDLSRRAERSMSSARVERRRLVVICGRAGFYVEDVSGGIRMAVNSVKLWFYFL